MTEVTTRPWYAMFDGNDSNTIGDQLSVNRRRVMRALGAAGLVGVAGASTASATPSDLREEFEKTSKAKESYTSPERIREAFRKHGGELLKYLEKNGLIESSSISSLSIELISDHGEFARADEGTFVGAVNREGTYSAHIIQKFPASPHEIIVFIQPQVGRSYAFVRDFTGDGGVDATTGNTSSASTLVIDPELNDEGRMSTNIDQKGCYCTTEPCPEAGGYPAGNQYERLCDSNLSDSCWEGEKMGCCSNSGTEPNCFGDCEVCRRPP